MKEINKGFEKVLVLSQLFYPELISTGQTMTELCEVLVELGVDVEVLCGPTTLVDQTSKVPRRLIHKGIKITRARGTRFPKLIFLGKLINHLSLALSIFFRLLFDFSNRPILVLTNPPFLALMCGFIRLIKGRHYIFLIFDVYPDTAVNLGVLKKNGLLVKIWDSCNRFTFKHASAIIVIGRCMREIIKRKIERLSIPEERLKTIHVWSDDKLIQSVGNGENPFIKKWNIKGQFVVGYSGNMGRFHEMETIMEAVKLLKDNKNITFIFTGAGYKKAWIQKFAEENNLSNCQIHSYVDRKDLGWSLTVAHIGLLSLSPGQEGLSVPSKLYGILAAGAPAIAVMTQKSESAMVIKENQCGFVIEPGDANGLKNSILKLYNDPELRQEMGQKGKNAINSKYNLYQAALGYRSIIKSLQS